MPCLSEIRYSREATVAAVSGYFDFLASMYLDEEAILKPPAEGWPEITPGRLQGLGKTDEVIMLLRHIPYLRTDSDNFKSEANAGPSFVRFWSWIEAIRWLDRPGVDFEAEIDISTIMTEPRPGEDIGLAPAHVVGLISTKQDLWLLDTELGVIYWLDCPGWIKHHPTREPILDDAYDYAAEGEADWRSEPAWAIVDFFELLKDQFRRLSSIPLTPTRVLDPEGVKLRAQFEGALSLVQAIYREHGWPDSARYRKGECLKAVRVRLEERYGEDSQSLLGT
jgi:hypothetical protein